MLNSVDKFLKKNGPSLSSEVTEFLIQKENISSAAARQRVSRSGGNVLRLDLSFPRRAKFLFLTEQAGTEIYWSRLEEALLKSKSAYGFAISALRARDGIMPSFHFEIACGSPVQQKKHLSANMVLQRLIRTNLLKETYVEGVGQCVYLGIHSNHFETLIPRLKARLLAEELILRGLYGWLRKLGFASYNQLKARAEGKNPIVSTTAWDLAGPSYLSPLVSFNNDSNSPNPGFVICDILLGHEVSEKDIQPFIQKLNALRSLRKVGKQLCFFVADSFSESAFKQLKAMGISPATTSVIFDNDIGKGLNELISLLSKVATDAISPEKVDTIFKTLGKVEGASNRLRGTLFEYMIAETMRSLNGSDVTLNRLCKTMNGVKEADVISVNHRDIRFIEGKGYNRNKRVTLEEVEYWLTQQIPVFRAFCLAHPDDWSRRNLTFEFWTTGEFTPEALERLTTAQQLTKKYSIEFLDAQKVTDVIKQTKATSLIKTFGDHFVHEPMIFAN
ncbi:conserved hypothetical protein [Vibrio crassostreae]|uniref:hypothetical protein n=1 Tax=Vibrio crassostreae TaxID=246167 RepID=UPI001B30D60B|nr:hypothetical protein [Vibrio crassostreae]CAK1823898.1 conserved hypothetical protein [Vibrio crassostreae]CAK1944282.1 conserved hypothetical protein [Vibrio crassostreae]CAK2668132.1 conserved hypothetical protein [Vibrio crassostreae]CAK2728270.1 conserved hypothetical protein [Vibrio crassostreae]CAK2740152.1 conserved hypothetical protein [Vibrio crassostreae]